MASTRELRRHIRSVRSTRQITKAMELVAASKLRKATDATLGSRPYALRISEAMRDALIVPDDQTVHPLLKVRPVEKVVVVVFASDRGLAGAYNTSIVKEVLDFITREREAGRTVQCITFGRKAEQALNRFGAEIIQSYSHSLTHPVANDVLPLARSLGEMYVSGACDQVMILYTHMTTPFKQDPHLTQFLPLRMEQLTIEPSKNPAVTAREHHADFSYEHKFLYEPTPQAMLEVLIPRYLETVLFQYLQESLASEHASRRMAMRNATDNATDILDDLQLTYNSVRQSSITQEIAEITSGAAALEQE
jgi:F-type H+-transporting ATPase subunit gamma